MIDATGVPPTEVKLDYTPDWVHRLHEAGSLHTKLLAEIAASVSRRDTPRIIDLSPNAALVSKGSHVRYRVELVNISGAVGDTIGLNIGTLQYQFVAGSAPATFLFPLIIERGVDFSAVDVTVPASLTWRCYLIGYPE